MTARVPVGALTASAASRVVEIGEARAYASLINCASDGVRQQYGLSVTSVAQATVFTASSVQESLMLNRVIGLGLEEPVDEASLASIERHYARSGVTTFALELTPAACAGTVLALLRQHGYVPYKKTEMMLRTGAEAIPAPNELQVQRVGASDAAFFVAQCCGVFRLQRPFVELLQASFGDSRWEHWAAFDGGSAVASAMTCYFDDATAWIGWVATQPEHRGRGAQSALAAAQVQACRAQGVNWISLEASGASRRGSSPSSRNYTRLGWTTLYERVVYLRRSLQAPNSPPAGA